MNVKKQGKWAISTLQLENWQRFIESKIGFVLPERQHHWLRQAIINVAQSEGLTPQQLLHRIRLANDDTTPWDSVSKKDNRLLQQVFDAVLIAESRFFRHIDSLNFIYEQVADAPVEHAQAHAQAHAQSLTSRVKSVATLPRGSRKTFKIWSAGCSRGQEVWSIAMVLAGLLRPVKIYGSDFSQQVLTYAKQATYSLRELNNIPQTYRRYTRVQGDTFSVNNQLHDSVDFIHHNLFTDTSLFATPLDIIICQNVLIYFRQFDQRDILLRLVAQLTVGGYLLLAPGEAVGWAHPKMKRVDNRKINAWKKVA